MQSEMPDLAMSFGLRDMWDVATMKLRYLMSQYWSRSLVTNRHNTASQQKILDIVSWLSDGA